ncbi:type 2 periplasmic-binding domain-containing protein [Legionella tunisiensis]|uniref:hypothetical protein n=1 Tax=Legionella tunisiensis TaxID=1034944 RepID=UPI00036A1C90|nr:hypothetical protein [Legionella tunisiensis]
MSADGEVARYWAANKSSQFNLVGNEIPIGIGYGIMTNKKHNDLIVTLNKLLLDTKRTVLI